MTAQDVFKWFGMVGQSAVTSDAPDDDGLFLYVSDWKEATVSFELPSGDSVEAFVTDVDPDGDDGCIWLHIIYSFGEMTRLFETWVTDTDVVYVGK